MSLCEYDHNRDDRCLVLMNRTLLRTFQVRPIVFDTLASALRISTKYEIQFLRDWAIAQMHTTWPSNLDQMVPMALPHAAGSSFSPPTAMLLPALRISA